MKTIKCCLQMLFPLPPSLQDGQLHELQEANDTMWSVVKLQTTCHEKCITRDCSASS